jgi:DNA-binding GntR family transcriptional regulator
MLDALKARDGARLARVLQQHLDHKFRAITEALSSSQRDDGPAL